MSHLALYSTGKPREGELAAALRAGGHLVDVLDAGRPTGDPETYDAHCVMGVTSVELWRELGACGYRRLFWDKPYNRNFAAWWRVSADAHQPVVYVGRASHRSDRAGAQGWLERIEPRAVTSPGRGVLIAGASPNYHAFADLPHPTDYARDLVEEIRRRTDRPIVYRPKPQWRDAEEIEGAVFSHHRVKTKGHRIRNDLAHCHAMITHGSSACLEALLAGVPTICLGEAVIRSISSTSLDDLEAPRQASIAECMRVVSNIAYCQWSLEEIAGGQAWPHIEKQWEAE